MRKKMEEIFEGFIDVEYETKCILEMMADYKDICAVDTMADWEVRMTVFLKALKGIYNDMHTQMVELDALISKMPRDKE